MTKDEKGPIDHLADAQDTLFAMEETARGLKAHMVKEGWSEEQAEKVAAGFLHSTLAVGMRHAGIAQEQDAKKASSGLGLLAGFVGLLAAIPLVIILCIAGFRWAFSL